MLTLNPALYKPEHESYKDMQRFYSALLAGFDILSRPANIQITPFGKQGDFDVSANGGTTTSYFDIGNGALGNLSGGTIANYAGRSFYHGALKLASLVLAAGSNGSLQGWLATGPPNNITHWVTAMRPITAGTITTDLTTPMQYDDVFFSLLRLDVQAGAGLDTARLEWFFHGFKIEY